MAHKNYNMKGRKSQQIAIADKDRQFYNIAKAAIEKHDNVLYNDEKTVAAFIRLLIKNADVCMEAISKIPGRINSKL